MAINKMMKRILKALSYSDVEVDKVRHLANLKAIDPMKIFRKTIDYKVYNKGYEVPMRIFLPDENTMMEEGACTRIRALLFFHGGGWVTDNVDNYERVCARLANYTNQIVISVDYRLAPEYPFPMGLEDCYAAAKALFTNQFILNIQPEDITLIGDSAGGNLTAALCLMARDLGEFSPRRQILIYPATNNEYGKDSPFQSVRTNGTGYLLTAERMENYLTLYSSKKEDRDNPYFAPILETNLENLPRTLIITAQYDPLRDEGEAYGHRLQEAGNEVRIHRIKNGLHGFFVLGIQYEPVKESLDLIKEFLEEDATC